MTNKTKKPFFDFVTSLIYNYNSKLKSNTSENNQDNKVYKNTNDMFISTYKETFRLLNQNNFFISDYEEDNHYISKSKFKTTLNHNNKNFILDFLYVFDSGKSQTKNICTIFLEEKELFTIQLIDDKHYYEPEEKFLIKIENNYIEKEYNFSLLESIDASSIFEKIHKEQLEIHNRNKEITTQSDEQKKIKQKTLVEDTLNKITQLREDSIYDSNCNHSKRTKIN